ncbi:MAG: aspartate 1-decarboxylase [Actinobacteria bacterium]|nr:aspartate 1-decarboxylase [Actinomycetota bacterium]
MKIIILKSKIHRAVITNTDINYVGSITIDSELLEHASIRPFEKVLVASIDSGERLETYVIEGKRGSREVCLNGAAAKKISKGDKVIIMSFAIVDEKEAARLSPIIVRVNNKNEIVSEKDYADKDDQC